MFTHGAIAFVPSMSFNFFESTELILQSQSISPRQVEELQSLGLAFPFAKISTLHISINLHIHCLISAVSPLAPFLGAMSRSWDDSIPISIHLCKSPNSGDKSGYASGASSDVGGVAYVNFNQVERDEIFVCYSWNARSQKLVIFTVGQEPTRRLTTGRSESILVRD